MQAVPVRGKLGHASKSIKFLSPRARRLLSLLFLGGVFFFAFLSFSTHVRDPEASNSRSGKKGQVKAGSALRRALSSATDGVSTISAVHVEAGTSEPVPRKPVRLLLASHNRLFWYSVDDNTTQVLHEGEVRVCPGRPLVWPSAGGVARRGTRKSETHADAIPARFRL